MLQSEKKQVDIVSQGTNTHGKGKDGVGGIKEVIVEYYP